jgi:hypothetical protein
MSTPGEVFGSTRTQSHAGSLQAKPAPAAAELSAADGGRGRAQGPILQNSLSAKTFWGIFLYLISDQISSENAFKIGSRVMDTVLGFAQRLRKSDGKEGLCTNWQFPFLKFYAKILARNGFLKSAPDASRVRLQRQEPGRRVGVERWRCRRAHLPAAVLRGALRHTVK